MAGNPSLDDKLAALRAFRGQTLTGEQKALLRKRIGDRSNLVAAMAAAIVADNAFVDLARDLETAFDRFLVNPLKDDKLCRAKVAVIQALDTMEHRNAEVFIKASRHVQMEPIWGGTEDSAPPLRAAGLVGLARIEGAASLPALIDAMVDPARDVRIASAIALGAVGTEAAGLSLRLKVRLGDVDPDVFSECLGGLLAVDPGGYLPLVAEYLEPANPVACEAAAMALGRSRLPEALGPLRDCLGRCRSSELRTYVLLAVAILRRPDAIDFLIGLVTTGEEQDAIDALTAMRIYKEDPGQRERIATLVRDRGGRVLKAAFEREFS